MHQPMELALASVLAFLLMNPVIRAFGILRAAADIADISAVCFACLDVLHAVFRVVRRAVLVPMVPISL